jgi:hypothetical protein
MGMKIKRNNIKNLYEIFAWVNIIREGNASMDIQIDHKKQIIHK